MIQLAERWRTLATRVTADLQGKTGTVNRFKPSGIVKAKMQAQIGCLLSCATDLENLLNE